MPLSGCKEQNIRQELKPILISTDRFLEDLFQESELSLEFPIEETLSLVGSTQNPQAYRFSANLDGSRK
jgi:hypothetical protein